MLKLIGLAVVAAGGWWSYSRYLDAKKLGVDPWRALQLWNLSVPEIAALEESREVNTIDPAEVPSLDLEQPTPGTASQYYDPDAPMEPGDWYYEA